MNGEARTAAAARRSAVLAEAPSRVVRLRGPAFRLTADQDALVEAFLADLAAVGLAADHKVRWGARVFLAKVGSEDAFNALPLVEQLAFNHVTHRFLAWQIATGRFRPTAEYLVGRRPRLGRTLRLYWPELHARFLATALAIGGTEELAAAQWNLLGHLAALAGVRPERLRRDDLDTGRRALLEAAERIPNRGVKELSTRLFGLEATLFHAGLTDDLPRRRHPDRADERAAAWATVAPGITATIQAYLAQIAVTLRPGTVKKRRVRAA